MADIITNDELALKIAHTEIWPIIGPSNEDILGLVKRYDAAKLEAMQPEVKETITLLRNLAGPDPYDERPTMHADLLYKAADLIERLAAAQGEK